MSFSTEPSHRNWKPLPAGCAGSWCRCRMPRRAPHLGSALSCVDHPGRGLLGSTARRSPATARPATATGSFSAKAMRRRRCTRCWPSGDSFPSEWLATYGQPGSRLPEQMSPGCVPGVEAATGSLGTRVVARRGHGVGGSHPAARVPGVGGAERRRVQRGFGVGSGHVRRRSPAHESAGHRGLQSLAGDRAQRRSAGPQPAGGQMVGVRLARDAR